MGEFTEIFSSEIVSTTGAVTAGVLLSFLSDKFSIIPGLIVFLPGFLAMRGNIAGSLSARMGSALHMGKMKPSLSDAMVKPNVLGALILTVITGFLLGIFSSGASSFFLGVSFSWKLVYIAVLSSVIAAVIQIPFIVASEIFVFKKGRDPDNIMGPLVTTSGDIISVASLFIILAVLL